MCVCVCFFRQLQPRNFPSFTLNPKPTLLLVKTSVLMPYGIIELSQHWFTNDGTKPSEPSARSYDIHLNGNFTGNAQDIYF